MLTRGIWVTRKKLECTILSQSYNCALRRSSSKPGEKTNDEKTEAESSKRLLTTEVMFPTKLDKFLLVWRKRYPSSADIPKEVPREMVQRVRNEGRIGANIIMCILTVLGCIAMIISGKRAAKKGETAEKMNLEWHKEMREKAEKS